MGETSFDFMYSFTMANISREYGSKRLFDVQQLTVMTDLEPIISI